MVGDNTCLLINTLPQLSSFCMLVAPPLRPVPRNVSGIQGAHDFQIHNSNISVVGGDSHTHTHTHAHTHVHHHGTTARDLQTILDAISNIRKIQQDTLAKATPGTIVWPFDCREFRLFVDLDGVLKLMWGSGIPGAGKRRFLREYLFDNSSRPTLMRLPRSIVIDKLEALAREWNYQICVAYVYIRYSDQNQLTVRGILEVFVKQTVERHPDCIPLAQQADDRHLREGTQPTEGELLLLLAEFVARRKATFYILDALDEAPVKIRLVLLQKLSSLGARLFITSRPLPTIEAKFPARPYLSYSRPAAPGSCSISRYP
ncbi:hypothetical protein BKA70DRAFT_1426069 [Coprinopsis sp. MPI-PUGE-AT-0042]|nr:hypothetical protein BKA70DRAFT_1426069 [Coprinopsis sp. MPI-PUGE-AT-0042]